MADGMVGVRKKVVMEEEMNFLMSSFGLSLIIHVKVMLKT